MYVLQRSAWRPTHLRRSGPPARGAYGPSPFPMTESEKMRVQNVHRVAYIDEAGRNRSKLFVRRKSAEKWRGALLERGKKAVTMTEGTVVWHNEVDIGQPTLRDETAPERSGGPGFWDDVAVGGWVAYREFMDWADPLASDDRDGPRWEWFTDQERGGGLRIARPGELGHPGATCPGSAVFRLR